jgi:hypothetical protein
MTVVAEKEVAKWLKQYPYLDALMVETILAMSEEEHIAFQKELESGELAEAPKELISHDVEII